MAKKLINTLEEAEKVFNSLGIRYTMKTFRYCAEKKIKLSNLSEFTESNLLDLIMLGTENITPDEASIAIEKWYNHGLSFPMLHTLTVKEARSSGFFMSEADHQIMGQMDQGSLDVLKVIMPQVTQDLIAMVNYQDGMKTVL